MNQVTKISHFYSYEQGCTQPAQVTLDSGITAVFKYPQNPEGCIVLFNELFSALIANAIELPIPNFGVAMVQASTDGNRQYNTIDGIGFFSEYIPKAVPLSYNASRYIVNLDKTCSILLFDYIVNNTDRYEKNILISVQSGQMFIIDHTHCFGDPDWTAADLKINSIISPQIWQENSKVYDMLIKSDTTISKKKLFHVAENIQASITDSLLDHFLNIIPRDWTIEIGEENLQHAKEYVLNQISNLPIICNSIIQEGGLLLT